jgi:hypothetical protein
VKVKVKFCLCLIKLPVLKTYGIVETYLRVFTVYTVYQVGWSASRSGRVDTDTSAYYMGDGWAPGLCVENPKSLVTKIDRDCEILLRYK